MMQESPPLPPGSPRHEPATTGWRKDPAPPLPASPRAHRDDQKDRSAVSRASTAWERCGNILRDGRRHVQLPEWSGRTIAYHIQQDMAGLCSIIGIATPQSTRLTIVPLPPVAGVQALKRRL